ncbi:MAG: ABC transporter permease [Bryobacteraceae bacterium]|jgi:predicted permease
MLQDVRFGIRTLLKNWGFTLVAMLSLAIGIGANSAIFSMADALLLRPLPVPRPGDIATVQTTTPSNPNGGLSYRDYVDLRDRNKSFDGLVGYSLTPFGFSPQPGALAQRKYGFLVTGNFFTALGVQPELGRGFRADEDRVPGRDAVVVLSHDLWEKQFGADRAAIGRTIRLNGIDFTVVGVAPENFTGMDQYFRPALYVPVAMGPRLSGDVDNAALEHRDQRSLTVKGRLRPGVGIARAQAELAGLAKGLERAYPDTNRNTSVAVKDELTTRIQMSPGDAAMVGMLMVLAVLVLLVACANVANLLLSRARARVREVAIRLAIGAGRIRLIRQLLTESLLIALGGALLGLPMASGGLAFLGTFQVASDLPIVLSVSMDHRVLLFAMAVSLLSVLLFGLTPALQTTRTDLVPALKASASDQAGKRRRLVGRNLLVVGQVAVSLVLLVVASMLYRGFQRYLTGGPGYRTDHLLLMSFDPTLQHSTEAQAMRFFRQVRDRALTVPGVKSAALTSTVPMSPIMDSSTIVPEGYQLPRGTETLDVYADTVDEHYFQAMDIGIVRGRCFNATDTADRPRVAVVNQEMARRYWPNQDAIGKRFRLGDRNGAWVQVVGVARTAKYVWIAEPPTPYLYLPLAQNPKPRITLIAESFGDAAALAAPLREAVRAIDADQPIFYVRTMQEIFELRAVKTPNMIIEIVGAMGLMGLVLAMVGLYGLVAYSVACRTREIGIRMAIGASQGSVLRLVLKQGLVLALSGIAIGLLIAVLAGKAVMAAFYTTNVDLLSYILVPLVLLAVTLIASCIPARRASLVEPTRALRFE